MYYRRNRAESGQTFIEYTLILATMLLAAFGV